MKWCYAFPVMEKLGGTPERGTDDSADETGDDLHAYLEHIKLRKGLEDVISKFPKKSE